ncbi:ATP-dependent helicase HrpB [Wenzhouxiangella sp. C33]|uniref:ATP-dependent helicase HrpB n=1 Tax=Wenzhouxiangella limi TaxID=2707351 RepID=A0A845VEE3_9GAMM|nr:ATP-dependent helicase HrpB [Wenzhouxiangella limi]NDY95619.1 ATP-dependent helicase HrpB [Wenzhouxiangella limi]
MPIDDLLPSLAATLDDHDTVLLTAPPGAGKTTRVPPALLSADWLGGRKILLLEPRRLAARAAARFMARELGDEVGQTVGYRTRLETRVCNTTRIEVVTEGILTRMLQRDPALDGIGCVIFDEFHERSLQADLGLALAREAQQALRPDLKLVVMSATLAVEPLKAVLDDPPLLEARGRSFPVEVHYQPVPRERRLLDHVAATVRRALTEHAGSVLVFLPGSGEIRRVAALLADHLPERVRLCPLYGRLAPAVQDLAIAAPAPGERKVVLASAIAESSLTIDGVRIVIDAGLARGSRFDPNSGMSRLVTGPVSRAGAEQRAGRAGRQQPGLCYRLWSEAQHPRLRAHTAPEIEQADLAGLVLELAHWGAQDPAELVWLDLPPAAHWQQAVDLLRRLNALDDSGRITAHGRALLEPGLHPRLAHLLLAGRARGWPRTAAELAALLSDRDPLPPGAGADLGLRLQALRDASKTKSRGSLSTARRLADRLAAGAPRHDQDSAEALGILLALAFPDRIAQARGGRGRYLLSNGRGAFLPEADPLAGEPWLVAAELDGQAREARIYLVARLSPAALESALGEQIEQTTVAEWDDRRGSVIARRRRCLGALVLEEQELAQPDPATIEAGLLAAVRRRGLDSLPWNTGNRQWQARVELLKSLDPDRWPAVDDATLVQDLEAWLAPFLAGARRWRDVERLDLQRALNHLLDPGQQQALQQLAPATIDIPTGRRVALDYRAEGGPVLATKLQSVFGWTRTPTIAGGRVPVTLHLLSPAGRALAITTDLSSFWRQGYPDVRKDQRGRYPKHPWPQDPLSAVPSDRTKARGG